MRIEPVSTITSVIPVMRVVGVNKDQFKNLDTLPKINDAMKFEIRKTVPDESRLQFLKDKKEILEKYPNPDNLGFAELMKKETENNVSKTTVAERISLPQSLPTYQAESFDAKKSLAASYSIIQQIINTQQVARKDNNYNVKLVRQYVAVMYPPIVGGTARKT